MTSRFSQGLKAIGTDERRGQSAKPDARDGQQPTSKEVAAPTSQARYMAPSRQGKKPVAGYFDPAVRQQLAVLAAEEQRSQNDLLAEALNLLFERYGKSPLA